MPQIVQTQRYAADRSGILPDASSQLETCLLSKLKREEILSGTYGNIRLRTHATSFLFRLNLKWPPKSGYAS